VSGKLRERDRILVRTISGASYFLTAIVVRFILGYNSLLALLVSPAAMFFAAWGVYWRLKVPFWRRSSKKTDSQPDPQG